MLMKMRVIGKTKSETKNEASYLYFVSHTLSKQDKNLWVRL